MVGMDFLGSIEPVADNGSKYILIVVDYFTKMVFATDCVSADSQTVCEFWNKSLVPIFGWPECLYTDNGSHFANAEVKTLFESRGSEVTYAPISHPESVGLAERMVMLISSQLRKWAIDKYRHISSTGDTVCPRPSFRLILALFGLTDITLLK
jgi:hypothetical protein